MRTDSIPTHEEHISLELFMFQLFNLVRDLNGSGNNVYGPRPGVIRTKDLQASEVWQCQTTPGLDPFIQICISPLHAKAWPAPNQGGCAGK